MINLGEQAQPANEAHSARSRTGGRLLILVAILIVLPLTMSSPAPALATPTGLQLTTSGAPTRISTQGSAALSIKGGTVSVPYSTEKVRTVKASKAFAVSGAKGKVTYKKISGNAKISVRSNGTIAVAKGLAKGTYKIKVAVKATAKTKRTPVIKKVIATVRVIAPKTVFIGDSRTCNMYSDLHGEMSDALIEQGIYVSTERGKELWVALGGAAYNDNDYTASATGKGNGSFAKTLLPYASAKIAPGDNVVILMGANDYGKNAANYVNLVKQYRKKKANWKATRIFFVSVTPYGYAHDRRDDAALMFNNDLQEATDAAGYRYIDAYTYMQGYRDESCYLNHDAIHYKAEYNQMVYRFLIGNIPAC